MGEETDEMMTKGVPDAARDSLPLSEAERSAIFANANVSVDRSVTLGNRRIPKPSKVVVWVALTFLIFGVGGQLGEHYLGNYGSHPHDIPTISTKPAPTPSANGTLSSLQNLMNFQPIGTVNAPNFTLIDQFGQPWSLSAQGSKVVVLAFYNSNCLDICPVVGAELRRASSELGVYGPKIEFAIVNTDPRSITEQPNPPALSVTGLHNHSSVVFLTGTLSQLDSVWTNFGVKIKVGAKRNEISHNNVLYFIGPHRNLGGVAEPFANVSSAGSFSLNEALINRFAKGIALTADSLAG
jgi:cytochrome oxidase Cu insertion factor (SCO1/SenC/PrrC family)